MALARNSEAPKHALATIQVELKRGLGELSGGDDAQLIRDTAAHLNGEVNAMFPPRTIEHCEVNSRLSLV
jgi:hypothetical protein